MTNEEKVQKLAKNLRNIKGIEICYLDDEISEIRFVTAHGLPITLKAENNIIKIYIPEKIEIDYAKKK